MNHPFQKGSGECLPLMVSHGVAGKPISVTERDKLESAKCYVTVSECCAWKMAIMSSCSRIWTAKGNR